MTFEIASRLKTQPKEYRFATFITCVESDALQVYNTVQLPADKASDNLDVTLDAMETHFVGIVNICERFVFSRRNQQPGESINTYLTVLRAVVRSCSYGAMVKIIER